MNRNFLTKGIMMAVAAMLIATVSWAQGDKASRPSPPQTASGKVGGANISIHYSSPSVKDRKIFGDLVPYDKIWRAGANEATIFETDKAVTIGGKQLAAGKYSLYATPGEKEWTFTFNAETGQWGIKRTGDTSKDASKDVLSVKALPVRSASMNEKLKYEVTATGFTLSWENTEVPVVIK